MLSVLVFDLDGTLVDSRRDIAESANELLATLDAPPLDHDEVVRMVGEGARLLVSRVLAAGGVREDLDAAFARFSAIYDRRLADHTRPYPGVVAGLERLAEHFTLAVLTNKPQHHTDRLLDALDLRRYFVQAIGGDTAHGRKPDPTGLCRASAPPARCRRRRCWSAIPGSTPRPRAAAGRASASPTTASARCRPTGLLPGEHRIASFDALAERRSTPGVGCGDRS